MLWFSLNHSPQRLSLSLAELELRPRMHADGEISRARRNCARITIRASGRDLASAYESLGQLRTEIPPARIEYRRSFWPLSLLTETPNQLTIGQEQCGAVVARDIIRGGHDHTALVDHLTRAGPSTTNGSTTFGTGPVYMGNLRHSASSAVAITPMNLAKAP